MRLNLGLIIGISGFFLLAACNTGVIDGSDAEFDELFDALIDDMIQEDLLESSDPNDPHFQLFGNKGCPEAKPCKRECRQTFIPDEETKAKVKECGRIKRECKQGCAQGDKACKKQCREDRRTCVAEAGVDFHALRACIQGCKEQFCNR
jgi:hypothetical protein